MASISDEPNPAISAAFIVGGFLLACGVFFGLGGGYGSLSKAWNGGWPEAKPPTNYSVLDPSHPAPTPAPTPSVPDTLHPTPTWSVPPPAGPTPAPAMTPDWAREDEAAKRRAAAENKLKAFAQALNAFAAKNGRWPASAEDLVGAGLLNDRSAGMSAYDPAKPYVLLPGEYLAGVDAGSIVAYDPVPTPEGGWAGSLLYVRRDETIRTGPESQFAAMWERNLAECGLRRLYGALKASVEKSGHPPENLDALQKDGLVTDAAVLRGPGAGAQPYAYVPSAEWGNRDDIIAYGPRAVGTRLLVLYADGRVGTSFSLQAIQVGLGLQDRRHRRPTPEATPPVRRPRFDWPPRPAPAVSNEVVIDGKKLTVDWPVEGWSSDPKLSDEHKFPKICQVIKEVTVRPNTARVGLTYGPEAASKSDEKFVEFRKSIRGFWVNDCKIDPKNIVEIKQKFGGVEYDRIGTSSGGQLGVSLLGIRDGRCVCYWFEGNSNCFTAFVEGLGQAKVKVDGAASAPKTE